MGRVLLAGLPEAELDIYLSTVTALALIPRTVTEPEKLRERIQETRRSGYAIVDQELELEFGLRSAATPIHDAAGRVIAAINTTAQASRVTIERLRREFVPQLLETAREIDADLAVRR